MNWNPYKRIAELEAMHTKNIAVLDTLADKLSDLQFKHDALGKWIVSLENRWQDVIKQLNPYAAAPVRSEGAPVYTKAEVDAEAERKRMQKREYNKAWYAKQRAKEKQRQYNATYRARKKAAAAAALVVGGTE